MTDSPIHRVCPVCDAGEAEPYLEKGPLRLVRCGGCSMIYANPVPPEFPSGQYYDRAGTEYYLSPAKLEADYAPVRFERELRFFRQHCPGGAVLDVGCSTGAFLVRLRHRFPDGYEILGTDVSGPALDYAVTQGVPVVRGDFVTHDLGEQKFEAISFWAVIEHLLAPKVVLAKASALLKPGGVCFVLVPNLRSLAARWLGARYRYIYPQHLNYFTRATLTRLVQNWFSVGEIRSTHFNPLVIWQDYRSGGAEVSNQERADLLKKTTAYKQNPWLKPAKALYSLGDRALGAVGLGDNLMAVLRRR